MRAARPDPARCLSAFAFEPAHIEVSAGTTVVWTNLDTTQHSVKSMATDGSVDASRGVAWRTALRLLRTMRGTGVRPTGDKARGALFNSLGSMLDLEGAAVLDLYAGSGALGLEALSRGAHSVLFVENGGGVLPVLRANLTTVGLPGGRVQPGSVPTVVAGRPPEPYDLVLADPPYATPVEEVLDVLRSLLSGGWLAPGAVLVVERGRREEQRSLIQRDLRLGQHVRRLLGLGLQP